MMYKYSVEEMMDLLAERTRKYTSNESTSITTEKASQLLGSIMYCLAETDKDRNDSNMISNSSKVTSIQVDRSKDGKLRTRFYEGLARKQEIIQKAKELYNVVMKEFQGFENECYIDTVSGGITAFFERYDVQFDATNHIILVDYPLYLNIDTLTGVDLIYEYLKRTKLEQAFLMKFEKIKVERLLYYYDKDWKNQLFNLCKIIVKNAIGCELVGKSIRELDINEEEKGLLRIIGEKNTKKELEVILSNALVKIITQCYNGDTVLRDYLITGMKEFAFEFKFCVEHTCLERLFIKCSSSGKEDFVTKEWFEEGINMPDDDLRELVKVLSESSNLVYRITLLKQHVKSLDDFRILMEECFVEEEYGAVYDAFTKIEIEIFMQNIYAKQYREEDLYPWEKYLLSTFQY